MTFPNPRVTDSGAPEVEQQDFETQVADHSARLAAEHGVKLPAEPEQDWYFTFGHGQTHPASGEDLMGAYVVIGGTYLGARQQMVDAFGLSWCDQYSSEEKAGVAMFGLRQIELPPPMQVEQAPPVTPAEERTGVSDVQHADAEEVPGLREAISRYGAARELFGAAREAADLTAHAEAQALAHRLDADISARLDRIAAQAPRRATDLDGNPIWLHTCGRTIRSSVKPDTTPGICICNLGGTWRALYCITGGAS